MGFDSRTVEPRKRRRPCVVKAQHGVDSSDADCSPVQLAGRRHGGTHPGRPEVGAAEAMRSHPS